MLKKFITFILTVVLFSCSAPNAYAQTKDMTDWKYKMLTYFSDQDPDVVVSKYINVDDENIYGFCLEPDEQFICTSSYSKEPYTDEHIFNLVKAYDYFKNEEDEKNYYIAVQLLIWKYLYDLDYTFKGLDYKDYQDLIIEYVNSLNTPVLMSLSADDDIYESYVNEENTIEGKFARYSPVSNDVDIIECSDNGLTYRINEVSEEPKTITLNSTYDPGNYSYVYKSSESQNIYSFQGEYDIPKPITFKVKAIAKPSEYTDILYSKKDEKNKAIAGAEFSLFEINDTDGDEELIFIHTNTDINLCEALLDNLGDYSSLSVKVSERYSRYLSGNSINTDEVGYFCYEIYDENSLVKQGRCYVSDDSDQTNNTYSRIAVTSIFKGYSEALDVNTINHIERNKSYYLCESEPYKGYTYRHNACKLIDTDTYNGEVLEYVNDSRTYSLKLVKHNRDDIVLNNARFKISYTDNNKYKQIYMTTGALLIDRENNYRYLIYRHEDDNSPTLVEFDGENYTLIDAKSGRYNYYQSDEDIIDENLLSNSAYVVAGGFLIENMPYSSILTVEEIQAPEGYVITEPVYYLEPDISYSQITFSNYRVNEFDILPKIKFKVPKTCIDE